MGQALPPRTAGPGRGCSPPLQPHHSFLFNCFFNLQSMSDSHGITHCVAHSSLADVKLIFPVQIMVSRATNPTPSHPQHETPFLLQLCITVMPARRGILLCTMSQLIEGGNSRKAPSSTHKPKAQLLHPLPVPKKRWERDGSPAESRLGLVTTETQHQQMHQSEPQQLMGTTIQTTAPPFPTAISCTPQAPPARQLLGAVLLGSYHPQAAGS